MKAEAFEEPGSQATSQALSSLSSSKWCWFCKHAKYKKAGIMKACSDSRKLL